MTQTQILAAVAPRYSDRVRTPSRAKPCAAILGAGWSRVAGLPLTEELFDRVAITMPGGDRLHYELVIEAYRSWAAENAARNAEEFLADVFDGRVRTPTSCERLVFWGMAPRLKRQDVAPGVPPTIPWAWAVQAIQLRLAEPRWRRGPQAFDRNSSSLRYKAVLLSRPECHAHIEFWRALRTRFDVRGVITTNYDLTAERAMRDRRAAGAAAFAYHYAAFDGNVRPVNSPYLRDRSRSTTPRGPVALAKLHGSLNWSAEGNELVIYPDFRPVWRHGGTAAIVPPLPEKRVPSWLAPIWSAADGVLATAHTWIVIGYSLPPYDLAVRELLRRASGEGGVDTVLLVDPQWRSLVRRWRDVAPHALVEGFDDLASATLQIRSLPRASAADAA